MYSAPPPHYATRISLFFGAFFFPYGIYIPFAGIWLKSLGLSPESIGIVLMVPLIARVVFTPVMAAMADKIGDRRLTLQIYCTLFALTFAFITIDDSLGWILAVMAISHITQGAIVPIADSLAMAGTRRYDLDYGRMRRWGSLAFVVANLAGGFCLDLLGANKIIWLMIGGNLLQIVFSLTLPKDPRLIDHQRMSKGNKLDWTQLKQFGQTGFWIVLASISLIQASHALLYTFGTIYWEQRGVAASMTGIFWSVSVFAEVLVFSFSKRISGRADWKALIFISGLLATLRWALMPFDMPEAGYLLLQLLHAGSFACSHLGTMFFIAAMVDDDLSGTAQGLYTMLTGLLMAIATYASGILYGDLGGNGFVIMAGISTTALFLLATSHLFPVGYIASDRASEAQNEQPK
ncbi:MFS transporter [Cohaesibacter intestini]|uniref:MFS transporter n=1 Tax=Cohaesibacter intestini TaxID=2211145 RepID=UPI000DE8013A|nr:MFS transporter [Cohaesibacter intestini]